MTSVWDASSFNGLALIGPSGRSDLRPISHARICHGCSRAVPAKVVPQMERQLKQLEASAGSSRTGSS